MGKSGIKGFDIDIFNLQNKQYSYDFAVDDLFFSQFEDSLIQKGKAEIQVILDKSDTFIKINLEIKGTIELICDRSLEEFDKLVDLKQQLIYKFGPAELELDDFMFQILKGAEAINLGQIIYEIICLSIPMKKLHPRYIAEEEEEEGVIIYSSEDEEEINDKQDDDEIDPRWQKLNELRNSKQ